MSKTKKVTLELTSEEVDAVEDAIWCINSEEWWTKMHKTHLGSFWKKLAHAFDEPEDNLCPKGYAIDARDCDEDCWCDECTLPDAPIKSDNMRTCPKCNGLGQVEDTGNHLAFTKTCELCDGVGKIPINSDSKRMVEE